MMAEELDKVNLALKKIKEARYGICEKCGKLISKERLIVYPQARYCKECNK
ncbi:TraR/DksA C4-type zinc finger protein [bacterium]|nr:TraR/DksA C4-type zinc finger protein [bacterium]